MAALLGPATQLGQQPGLADPGLAFDGDAGVPAALQIVERLPEPFELRLSPDRMVVAQRHRWAT